MSQTHETCGRSLNLLMTCPLLGRTTKHYLPKRRLTLNCSCPNVRLLWAMLNSLLSSCLSNCLCLMGWVGNIKLTSKESQRSINLIILCDTDTTFVIWMIVYIKLTHFILSLNCLYVVSWNLHAWVLIETSFIHFSLQDSTLNYSLAAIAWVFTIHCVNGFIEYLFCFNACQFARKGDWLSWKTYKLMERGLLFLTESLDLGKSVFKMITLFGSFSVHIINLKVDYCICNRIVKIILFKGILIGYYYFRKWLIPM